MNKKYLQSFIEVAPYLPEILQQDINFAVADSEKFLMVQNGKRIESKNKTGDKFSFDEYLKSILQNKKTVSHISPAGHFNIPTQTTITPVLDENGESAEVLIFTVIDMEQQVTVESASNKIFSAFEQINAAIEEIASGSMMLSTFIVEIVEYITETMKKINKVDSIIQVIKNISSQSNLLALNATIEAARAGEAGKGFNVVAGEMGKLSRQSKDSADSVKQSLLEIKNAIETIDTRICKIKESSESQTTATQEIASTVELVTLEMMKLAKAAKLA